MIFSGVNNICVWLKWIFFVTTLESLVSQGVGYAKVQIWGLLWSISEIQKVFRFRQYLSVRVPTTGLAIS